MSRDRDIILIDADEQRRQREAPNDFDWERYPDGIHVEGDLYVYVGCIYGTPHYRTMTNQHD